MRKILEASSKNIIRLHYSGFNQVHYKFKIIERLFNK